MPSPINRKTKIMIEGEESSSGKLKISNLSLSKTSESKDGGEKKVIKVEEKKRNRKKKDYKVKMDVGYKKLLRGFRQALRDWFT